MAQSADLINSYSNLNTMVKQVIAEFKKIMPRNKFFINKPLLVNSGNYKLVKFNSSKWHLRPEYYANDFYGEPELFYIVLLANDIYSRFNFRQSVLENGIITPKIETINQILTNQM